MASAGFTPAAGLTRFCDDAWDELEALPSERKVPLVEVLLDLWIQGGPVRDRTVLVNGVVKAEATFAFGVTARWVESTTNSVDGAVIKEALVLKVRLTDQRVAGR